MCILIIIHCSRNYGEHIQNLRKTLEIFCQSFALEFYRKGIFITKEVIVLGFRFHQD
jgi:hypothetical protein